ncbi:MAG: ABC transporter substrate-binding protein [Patescibacteria group bacterium]
MNNGLKTVLGAAICVAALAFLVASQGGARTLSFGAILPLSGANERVGKAEEAGLSIAEEKLEMFFEEGNLRVLVRDSEISPDVGASVAKDLVEKENINALFSSMSVVTAGVSEVARENEVPMFYDSCNCGFAQANPYALQLFLDPRKECKQVAEDFYLKASVSAIGREYPLTAAYVGQEVPYANFCIDAVKETEFSVLVEKDVEGIARPYEALFTSWKAQGVSFIVSIPPSAYIVEILEANETSGAQIPFYCAASQCLTDDIVSQVSPEALKNVTAFDFQIREEFIEEIQLKIGKKILSRDEIVGAAVAHDALVYAATAASRCGEASVACIQKNATHPLIPLAIVSEGFDEGRILKYTTAYTTPK